MTPSGATPVIVLATRNQGKLSELRDLCAALPIRVIDLDEAGVPSSAEEDAIEVHATFAENARAKARYYAARVGDLPVIAEDSGLEVQALGGEPGVRSRRFANIVGSAAAVDAANNALLLRWLEGVEDRRARFSCVVCLLAAGREVLAEGSVDGRIVESAAGIGGFGYDPLFWSPELGCTFAEAATDAKARVSHRGRALEALVAAIGLTGGGSANRLSAASGA